MHEDSPKCMLIVLFSHDCHSLNDQDGVYDQHKHPQMSLFLLLMLIFVRLLVFICCDCICFGCVSGSPQVVARGTGTSN